MEGTGGALSERRLPSVGAWGKSTAREAGRETARQEGQGAEQLQQDNEPQERAARAGEETAPGPAPPYQPAEGQDRNLPSPETADPRQRCPERGDRGGSHMGLTEAGADAGSIALLEELLAPRPGQAQGARTAPSLTHLNGPHSCWTTPPSSLWAQGFRTSGVPAPSQPPPEGSLTPPECSPSSCPAVSLGCPDSGECGS